jgi:hypothetical protein
MYEQSDKSNFNVITQDVTGSIMTPESGKSISYPFGKYVIKVKLTDDNKFMGILEIKINKDFLDYKQKLISKGIHDVDEYYRE